MVCVTPKPSASTFPISISANQRYIQAANGSAFLLNGESPWSLVAQCTDSQIDAYLDDRAAKGFTAVLFEAPLAHYTSQTPSYNNTDGVAPFTSTSFTAATWESPVEAYWVRVDRAVNRAKALGMVCVLFPAYLGFGGGTGATTDEGWDFVVNAATNAHLQAFGAFLASRYTQGNIIWCLGGDYQPPDITKQWNIAVGIRSVTPNAILTAHSFRAAGDSYSGWNGQSGYNCNATYGDGTNEADIALSAYAHSAPVMPFFLIESVYEGEGATAAELRRQAYTTILSGGCGAFFGNVPVWGFGEPNKNGGAGAASVIANNLNTTGAQQRQYVKTLFGAYQWGKLAPKSDASLVSSSLSSGATRVCPALASDGSFAMVWIPSAQSVTVVMSSFTHASVRGRFYDPTAGTYSAVSGSPFANTGSQVIVAAGECILVLD